MWYIWDSFRAHTCIRWVYFAINTSQRDISLLITCSDEYHCGKVIFQSFHCEPWKWCASWKWKLQGVSKKRYFLDFSCYFSSRGRILLFHMCFGIRILSPLHLAIQKVSIQNLNCPKNAKNACADMIFIPAQSSLRKAGIKIMSAHAFLGQLRFWMDTFWIARWNSISLRMCIVYEKLCLLAHGVDKAVPSCTICFFLLWLPLGSQSGRYSPVFVYLLFCICILAYLG